ncbi:MAG: hypothetical protein R2851_11320 [Caldilineaceae bacterium]
MLTLATTVVVVVIPTLLGLYLLLESFQALAHDVAVAVQSPQERLLPLHPATGGLDCQLRHRRPVAH